MLTQVTGVLVKFPEKQTQIRMRKSGQSASNLWGRKSNKTEQRNWVVMKSNKILTDHKGIPRLPSKLP